MYDKSLSISTNVNGDITKELLYISRNSQAVLEKDNLSELDIKRLYNKSRFYKVFHHEQVPYAYCKLCPNREGSFTDGTPLCAGRETLMYDKNKKKAFISKEALAPHLECFEWILYVRGRSNEESKS